MKTREEEIEDLRSKIFQTIGQASMCWQFINRGGIYQSNDAVAVGEDLIGYIMSIMEFKKDITK